MVTCNNQWLVAAWGLTGTCVFCTVMWKTGRSGRNAARRPPDTSVVSERDGEKKRERALMSHCAPPRHSFTWKEINGHFLNTSETSRGEAAWSVRRGGPCLFWLISSLSVRPERFELNWKNAGVFPECLGADRFLTLNVKLVKLFHWTPVIKAEPVCERVCAEWTPRSRLIFSD